jgi:hypothetical protein
MIKGEKMFLANIGEVAGTSAITITEKLYMEALDS